MSFKGNFNIFCKKVYNNRANIEFYTGTGLTMLGTYLFARAARKNEEVLNEYKLAIAITSEDDKETRKKILMNVIKKSAKNYGLATAVDVIGYSLLFRSNVNQNKNIADLNMVVASGAAAYEALKEKYISKYGIDEWEALNGVKVENVIDAETGEETKEISYDTKENTEPFSVIFDKNNNNYMNSKGDNRRFILAKQKQANSDLDPAGIILLPTILTNYLGYSLKDFDPDWLKSISRAGWFARNEEDPMTYIDFGLQGNPSEAVRAFMNDEVKEVRLTFNCERDVYAAVQKYGEMKILEAK